MKKLTVRKFCLFCLFALLCFSFPLGVEAQPALTGLTINEDIIPGPDNVYLTVSAVYADGSRRLLTDGFACHSSNPDVAKAYPGGLVRFTGKGGNVTITVFSGGFSASKSMYVRPWPEEIEIETNLVKSDNPYPLMIKARFSDDSTGYLGPNDPVQWSTSNPWVAWVNSQGVVTFTGDSGHVTIKAVVGKISDSVSTTVTGDDDDSDAFYTGIKIKEEIKYSPEPLQVQLAAVLSDGSETDIANSSADWSSSDSTVASVNAEGEITFTGKPGFTTIKVTYGGYDYETLVTVGRFLENLSINQSLNYTENWDQKALPLSVTARYNDGSEHVLSSGFIWSTDNTKVASITENGVLTFTGQAGAVTVSVKGLAYDEVYHEDSIRVEVPAVDKPIPLRLSIDTNPVSAGHILTPKVYCLYSDGSLRDVTDKVAWSVATPETASVFKRQLYLTPNPGPIRIAAQFTGLSDEIRGYSHKATIFADRVSQLRIKQHFQAYSYSPVTLTALAIMGDRSIRDVTSEVQWHSSQPLVARIDKGKLTFTGRTGRAVITAQGYGYRDELNIEVSPAELQPQVVRLEIQGEITRAANQLKAVAHFNDGTSRDVTAAAVWNTNNRNTAPVTAGVVMFPTGLKSVRITADYGGQEAALNYR